MDKTELAKKIIKWKEKRQQLDKLEEEIKHEVMLLEESFSVADANARFNGGKRTFDYETGGKDAPPEIIEKFTVVEKITDWKSICEEIEASYIPYKTGNPSVTLSIKEEKTGKKKEKDELPF